jgi:hypothetical protein
VDVAVILVDAGAAEFEHLGADRFKGREVKFLGTVKAEVSGSTLAGLHAIGAHHFAIGFHQEMIAGRIVGVFVAKG